jgi:dipeptidyl aminopeptidase/acylaminoacyl peptidase
MRVISDIQYIGTNENQKLDVLLPDTDGEYPVFVYFHGGGIKNGDKANTVHSRETITNRGIVMVSVNYRMYPETKYPEFLEDAAAAVAWTFKNIGNYCTPKGIYVGGSSAGGYLSMMLCFDKKWLAPYSIYPTDIAGYIHDAGQPTAHFTVLKYEGYDPRRVIVNEMAPLYHIGVDANYAPMLFIVSDNDMQNRYEQTMLVLSTLKHFGHTEPEIQCKVMHGTHCHYTKKDALDENGVSPFGTIAADYILYGKA